MSLSTPTEFFVAETEKLALKLLLKVTKTSNVYSYVLVSLLLQQLLQIMLPGVIEMTQMKNGTKMETLQPGQYMTFYQYGDSKCDMRLIS
jgi:hypothetical protein